LVQAPIFSSDGKIYEVQINAIEAPYNPGMGRMSGGKPGAIADLNLGINYLYRCRITNYASTPIFKASFSFRAIFWEAIKDEANAGGQHNGKMTLNTVWNFEIPKIEPGKDSPFDLYFFNMTSQFVQVLLPVQVILFDGQIANLVQPISYGMHFSPNPSVTSR